MTMFQYYKRSRHFVFSAFIAFVFVLLCQNTAFARASSNGDLNRPGFPGEYFICELRLPDHYFR
ncbi:hypothetical protein, partial [Escherichia coli]